MIRAERALGAGIVTSNRPAGNWVCFFMWALLPIREVPIRCRAYLTSSTESVHTFFAPDAANWRTNLLSWLPYAKPFRPPPEVGQLDHLRTLPENRPDLTLLRGRAGGIDGSWPGLPAVTCTAMDWSIAASMISAGVHARPGCGRKQSCVATPSRFASVGCAATNS